MESITIKRLRTKAVFKIIFIGLVCSFVPFFTIMGILASQGLVNMYWGQIPITGFKAALLGPIYGLLFAFIIGLFISGFTSIGLMIYGKRKPITLELYQLESDANN